MLIRDISNVQVTSRWSVQRFCSVHVGFYLISPSEYERFSLSAKVLTAPLCSVQLDRLLEAR